MATAPVTLHYESTGQGQPLIILHGLFGSLTNWRPLVPKFSEHFHVFTLDLRNHGRSPHSDIFSYAAMAEDIRAFIRQHQLASPYLLGHSLGGKVAMQFALTYPNEVEKLIVVDMTPRATPPRYHSVITALQALDFEVAQSRRDLDAQLAGAIPDKTLRQFLLTNVRTDDNGRFGWRINLDAIAAHYNETNEGIKLQGIYDRPVLFIRGGKSDYIGDEDIEAINALFPRAEVATVNGAGHWVHAEAPEEFARVVLEFLG
jgi:pimeloyl-ACP methyl ester carboxylesterase